MTINELFADLYAQHANDERIKAERGTFDHFRIACKYLCGGMTTKGLTAHGVSQDEIKAATENKIIRYEPNMGITRRESGYVLTAKGVKTVYSTIR